MKEAIADGDLRPDIDPVVTAKLLFGLVNSVTEWYRPGRAGHAPRQGGGSADVADAICKLAFDGLRAA